MTPSGRTSTPTSLPITHYLKWPESPRPLSECPLSKLGGDTSFLFLRPRLSLHPDTFIPLRDAPALPVACQGRPVPSIGHSGASAVRYRSCSPGIDHTVPHPTAAPSPPVDQGSPSAATSFAASTSLSIPVCSRRSATKNAVFAAGFHT